MRCKAGKKWGKNFYECCLCGNKLELKNNDEILPTCTCGSKEYKTSLKFTRSANGCLQKLDEIIHILEVSIFLCKALKLEEFYNVIAIQLRIILYDNKDIIKLKVKDPMFYPHKEKVFDKNEEVRFISSDELFDESKSLIPLETWLNQEVAWSKNWDKPITIENVIKAWANKNGGAHVDNIIHERQMFIITVFGDYYLIEIAKYTISMLGYDLEKDIVEHFLKPYNLLLNS